MDDVNFPGWQPEKSIQVIEDNGLTGVLVRGRPYMRWRSGDEQCVRLAIVQLYECGLGAEEDLAKAFGRPLRSVQRYVADFDGEGMQGLMSERRGPKGRWKLTPELRGTSLERQTWGEDGGETLTRPRSESIWIGWNKALTMRMLAGCCLRRCSRDIILLRR